MPHVALHMVLRTYASIRRLDAVLTERQVANPRTPSPDPESSRFAMAPEPASAKRGRWGDESASDVSIRQPGMGDDRSAEPGGSDWSRDMSVRQNEGSAADERQQEGLPESRWVSLHKYCACHAHWRTACAVSEIYRPSCRLLRVGLQSCKHVLHRRCTGSGQSPSFTWPALNQPGWMGNYHLESLYSLKAYLALRAAQVP